MQKLQISFLIITTGLAQWVLKQVQPELLI